LALTFKTIQGGYPTTWMERKRRKQILGKSEN
jgi:hypothetical protein